MIFSTRTGNTRVAFDLYSNGTLVPPPGYATMGGSSSGQRVTPERAFGLPVVSRAIRVIGNTIASMEPAIFERRDGFWQPIEDAPERRLACVEPNVEQTPFDFYQYASACIEGWGNYFARKIWHPRRREIVEFGPIHPGCVQPKVEDGELVYKVREPGAGSKTETLTRHDILHIPGSLLLSPYIGVSPIHLHRDPLGRELAMEQWGGQFYANDQTPGLMISSRLFADKRRREEFLEGWEARHRRQAHMPGLLWGEDMTMETVGIAPKDAEYVESIKAGVRTVGNMFDMDSGMLNDPDIQRENTEQTMLRFLTLCAGPRATRIWQAISADRDIFPDPNRRLGFLSESLRVVDAKAQAEVDLRRRQSGTRTSNELRAKDGYPPHPDGDDLQATPVGGAPNPDAGDPPAQSSDR